MKAWIWGPYSFELDEGVLTEDRVAQAALDERKLFCRKTGRAYALGERLA